MSTPLGAHAAARKQARINALHAFGIDPDVVDQMQESHSLAQKARQRRETTLEGSTEAIHS